MGSCQGLRSYDVDDSSSEESEDWVIATGKTTKIRDFVKMAFDHVGIELEFSGSGVNEVAKVAKCNNPNTS